MPDLKPLPKPVPMQKSRDVNNNKKTSNIKAVPHQEIIESARKENVARQNTYPNTYQPPRREKEKLSQQQYTPKRAKPNKVSPFKRLTVKAYRFIKKGGGPIISAAAVFIVTLSLIMWLLWFLTHHNAYAVYVNEERVDYIAMAEGVDLNALKSAISNHLQNNANALIQINEEIRIVPVNSSPRNITEFDDVIGTLANDYLSYLIVGSAIYVDGVQRAILRNRDEALQVERSLLTRFTHNHPDHYYEIGFYGRNFSINATTVNEVDLVGISEAFVSLNVYTSGVRRYIVQRGDTLGTIAERHGMDLDDLLADNPHVSVNRSLSVDTELLIQYQQPLLPVRTVESVTRRETIPVDEVESINPDRYRSSSRVINYGTPGEKEIVIHITRIGDRIVSEETISERELRAMIPREIEVGTRVAEPNRR